jgi:hypothetical protein
MRYMTIIGLMVMLLFIAACGQKAPPVVTPPVQAAPTCTDGIQNQGEAAIDCGGPCAACQSCTDGLKNQGETAVDCGGPCQACSSCTDGIKNQDETAIDCGGSCKPCAVPPAEVKLEVSDADKETITERLKTVDMTFAKTTAMDMKVGDSFVFALGITNNKIYASRFRVNVTFERARDRMNNPIALNDLNFDSSYIYQWFGKNDFSKEIALEPRSQAIFPIIVTVGDMYTAKKTTVPGSYYFKAIITYYDEFDFWNEYAEVPFTVNIA